MHRRGKRSFRPVLGAAATVVTIGSLLVGGAGVATAAVNPPTGRIYTDQAFYVYVGAGETLDVAFTQVTATSAPVDISAVDPTGLAQLDCTVAPSTANGVTCSATDLSATAGVWTIAFEPGDPGSRYLFDIVVRDAADAEIPGRTWTTEYAQYQSGAATQSYWIATREGYLYGLDLINYGALGSALRSNGFGLVEAGTCTPIYRSAEGTSIGANGVFLDPSIEYSTACGDDYLLFLEAPDPGLPASAASASGPMWIRPAVVPPSTANLQLTESSPLTRAGSIQFDLTGVNGGYSVQLDTNDNGDFTDPVDRVIPWGSPPGAISVPFDGLDGAGDPIGVCQAMNARVVVDRVGETHFVLEDVEQLGNGAATAAGVQLRGLTAGVVAPNPLLYWDDSDLTTVGRAPGEPFDGPTGAVDTTTLPAGDGAHGWRVGWGDMRSIENWTYFQANAGVVAALDAPCAAAMTIDKLAVLDDLNANGVADEGEAIQYSFLVENTGNADLSDVAVDDPHVTGILPVSADIAVAASQLFIADPYVVTAQDVLAGSVSNTATATGTDPAGDDVETPPDTTTVVTIVPPVPPTTPSGGGLANSGSDPSGLVGVGLTALVAGALVVLIVQLRRRVLRRD